MTEVKKNKCFEVAVVGVTFEGRQDILADLCSKTKLTGQLKREADNRYDSNAVAVEVEGKQIGYIPKALAAKLAAHMDAGESIGVVGVRIIEGSKDNRSVYGVRIDIEMEVI